MYKPKPCRPCELPAPGTSLKAVVPNGSLKPGKETSNTEELATLVLDHMREHAVSGQIVEEPPAGPRDVALP